MKWTDTQWFGPENYGGSISSSTTSVVDVGTLGTDSTTNWNSTSSSTITSDSGELSIADEYVVSTGSGSVPSISIGADYWLRDNYGAVLVDDLGDGLSLEGI